MVTNADIAADIGSDVNRSPHALAARAMLCFIADTIGRYFLRNEQSPRRMAALAAKSAKRRTKTAGQDFFAAKYIENNRLAAERNSADTDITVVFLAGRQGAPKGDATVFCRGVRRCVMPIVRNAALALAAALSPFWIAAGTAQAQSALDAAQELAQMLDGAGATSLDGDNLVTALEGAAAEGQPIALWQLGVMYETGAGVEKDPARAFQYFSQIANDNADTSPNSFDADIVAQSFVKIGDYFLTGLPDAGIAEDNDRGRTLIMHAASYFGDADAQYRVGMLYLDAGEMGHNPLQSARWFSLAARKGHPGAQARLGDMLVHGEGIEPQIIEGLMWLNIAYRRSLGTGDEGWIRELAEGAMAHATPEQAEAAVRAADTLGSQFAEY